MAGKLPPRVVVVVAVGFVVVAALALAAVAAAVVAVAEAAGVVFARVEAGRGQSGEDLPWPGDPHPLREKNA